MGLIGNICGSLFVCNNSSEEDNEYKQKINNSIERIDRKIIVIETRIEDLRKEVHTEMEESRKEIRDDIKELRKDLRQDIRDLKQDVKDIFLK